MKTKTKETKALTAKIASSLTKKGYKVFTDVPIIDGGLPFIAVAPDELFVLGEVLPKDFTEEELKMAVCKLLAVRARVVNLFSNTLEDIKINVVMFIVCAQKKLLSNKMQSILYYHLITLLSFGRSSMDFSQYLPKIEPYSLNEKYPREDFDAYVGYCETIIRYLTTSPVGLYENLHVDIFGQSSSSTSTCIGLCENSHANIFSDLFDDEVISAELNEISVSKFQSQFDSPRKLADEVKKYVKGQDEVIDRISVPFFQHLESKRLGTTCDIKSSFLLVGSTGTGKSEILRRFAEISDVPVVRINTSDCVPNSWKGQHISDLIGYYINNKADLEKMKYSVIVFNEFDKIAHYNQNLVGNNSTDWDADMQRDFLKFFDKGYELVIEKQKGIDTQSFRLPTDNLLICFDGAFSGIEKIIEKRLNLRSRIGFVQRQNTTANPDTHSSIIQQLNVADLEKWGYKPELLGRIGTFIVMNPMLEDLIYEIITTASENILNAHKVQCKNHGFELEFTEDALRKIAKIAAESGFGFRSVKAILANLMEEVYFDCHKYKNTTLTIDESFIALVHFRNKYRPLIKDYKKLSQGKLKVEQLLEKYGYTQEEYANKLKYLKQL